MTQKSVKIWNSEIAYRIDSQLRSTSDKAVFRKLLSQNELNEAQLRSLLRRWRRQGNPQSFCEFLVKAGLVAIEKRKIVTWGSIEYNHDDLHVSLTPQARSEFENEYRLVDAIVQFLRRMLVGWHAESQTSEETLELTHVQATADSTSSSRSINRSRTRRDGLATACSPVPVHATSDDFDPYATVYDVAVQKSTVVDQNKWGQVSFSPERCC